MSSLCPVCGKYLCDHTPAQRGQTKEEFDEDINRDMTPEELKAWRSDNRKWKLQVAQDIALQRRKGTFKPHFPWDN